MLRGALLILGVLFLVSSVLGIGIKLFGSYELVAQIYGGRNLDAGIFLLLASLVMLTLVKIVDRLEDIEAKLDNKKTDSLLNQLISQSKIEKSASFSSKTKLKGSSSTEPKSVQPSKKLEEVYRGYEILRGLDSNTKFVEDKEFYAIANARKYIDHLINKETNKE